MRHLAFALIALPLTVVSLGGQSSDARLERALDRIERNDANGLRRLLQEDPSLVRRTEAGVLPHWRWTLLHVATAQTSPLEIVTALVDAGSDVNAKDNEGNTPLHFAMKRISREKLPARDYDGIIRLLIETTFTMTASPFTQDFHLCRVFEPVSPSNNESVAGRPVLRWDPYPDAVRYYVVVLLQGKSVFTRGGPQGDLTATSFQLDVDLPPGAYQWRLFAYNAAGQMIGCAIAPRAFNVRP